MSFPGTPSLMCQCNALSKAEDGPRAAKDLRAHGLPGVGSPGSGILVLGGAAEEVVEALCHAAPGDALDDLLLDLGLVATIVPGGGEKRAGDFVGHALELCVDERSELLAAGELLLAETLGEIDGVGVVGGDDDAAVRPRGGSGFRRGRLDDRVVVAVDESGHHAVVGCVGVFDGVVDEAALLREKVGTTDELSTKSEAFLASDVDVLGESGGSRLEVALVGVVEDSFALTVEDALKVESPSVVARQVPVLLGGGKKADALLGSSLADELHGLIHGLAGVLLRGAKAECCRSHSTPLETDEVTFVCDGDGCKHALLPVGNVLQLVALSILEDFQSVLQNHTAVSLLAQLLGGGADLLGSRSSAELLVEGVVEEGSRERVLLKAEEEVLALKHATQDCRRRIEETRRRRDGGDQVRTQNLAEREECKSRSLSPCGYWRGDSIGSGRVEARVGSRVLVVWRGVDVPAVGRGLCVCVSGRDVAEGRGLLLGEGREGVLERLDADGVHGIVDVGVVISKMVLGGRGDNETEGAVGQRKAVSYLANGHIWAPYWLPLLGSQAIAFCKAAGANRSNRRCC
jgi:hypothetical protein